MSKNKADTMASNFQGAPDAKKPCKGILKTSSSFDKHSLAKWILLNLSDDVIILY